MSVKVNDIEEESQCKGCRPVPPTFAANSVPSYHSNGLSFKRLVVQAACQSNGLSAPIGKRLMIQSLSSLSFKGLAVQAGYRSNGFVQLASQAASRSSGFSSKRFLFPTTYRSIGLSFKGLGVHAAYHSSGLSFKRLIMTSKIHM